MSFKAKRSVKEMPQIHRVWQEPTLILACMIALWYWAPFPDGSKQHGEWLVRNMPMIGQNILQFQLEFIIGFYVVYPSVPCIILTLVSFPYKNEYKWAPLVDIWLRSALCWDLQSVSDPEWKQWSIDRFDESGTVDIANIAVSRLREIMLASVS